MSDGNPGNDDRQEKPTFANGLLDQFTIEQRRWVLARLSVSSDAKAARMIGVHPSTVSKWPEKPLLDEAVIALLSDACQQAKEILRDALVEAARTKASGLKSRNERIRQDAASEILDRMLGKPGSELTLKQSEPFEFVLTWGDGREAPDPITRPASEPE